MRRVAHVTNSRGKKCSPIFTHKTYPLILKLNLERTVPRCEISSTGSEKRPVEGVS